MGRKIFVSYKYADSKVRHLSHVSVSEQTTVRNYVDLLQDLIDETDNINKGEDDGEDMSSLADATISTKLGDKIFDSSVTIVLISKGMKDCNKLEKEQWIPWEISYSLREQSRNSGKSKTNAMLAIVIPDENGSYDYFITNNNCLNCYCRTLHTSILFDILNKNMFNIKEPMFQDCSEEKKVYIGEPSYIKSVKWDDINSKENFKKYIDLVVNIKENIDNYDVQKNITNG